jgi:hypothetical protein
VREHKIAFSRIFLAGGAAIFVGAVAWWWTTFGDVVSYGYLSWREAGRCLVGDSDICTLAKALCLGTHPRSFVTYWASAFWIGVGVLSLSLLTNRARVTAP